ncbi:MAG: hypothetical protein O3B06_10195 [Actinobacteria bacterium]|nr:hypothetical protein [Actinomycetota bacterium]
MRKVDDALRQVWIEHRPSILEELVRLSGLLDEWNGGANSPEIAGAIEHGAHRICGSLTIVGRRQGLQELRQLEVQALGKTGPYAKEVVDRVHDLLERLRND